MYEAQQDSMLPNATPEDEIDRQLPQGDEIFLDHVGHFVRSPDAAAQALARAGFTATPVSIQVNPDGSGGEQPTGTGNTCAMLRRGYVECLFKTADTPLGHELDAALQRYPGVHLIAFSVHEAEAAHTRLQQEGFRACPLVSMGRPVETEQGRDVAAFTVVRVEPGVMPEGRIQMLRHHTEHTVWQPRWLDHPNSAIGLLDVVIAATDPSEVAKRYARFLGRSVVRNAFGYFIKLDRGGVQIVSQETVHRLLPNTPAVDPPFIGLYAMKVQSLHKIESCLGASGMSFNRRNGLVIASFPEQLGIGVWFFAEQPSALPWRSGG
jgi:Glyoxalase-like domain